MMTIETKQVQQMFRDLRDIVDEHLEVEDGIPGDPENPTYAYINDRGIYALIDYVLENKEQ